MHRIGIVVGAVSLFVAVSASASPAAPALDPAGTGSRSVVEVQHASPTRPLIAVSHRGAAGHAPENTLAALDAADELGAETVEIDIQRTADNHIVLLHDTTLARTTNVESVFPDRSPYLVGDFTLREIKRLDAGSWFAPSFTGERIPTFDEALDRLERLDLNLFLEVKEPALYPGIERAVAEELAGRRTWLEHNPAWEPRKLIVQSFDWDSVRRSKSLLPSVPHALLGRVPEARIGEFTWAHMINPNHTTIDAAYVQRVQDAGLEIMPYTINDRQRMDHVLGLGVDGFITDFPDTGQRAIADFNGGRDAIDRAATPAPALVRY
ncbi:glycerophosphodiester phosphodiesterase family protein [Nocardiopsis sp. NPDC006198]|uniref:glycerophosphodiester phosphodiesterase n=1 Tax=Nocardiopsis sp. NPDC006198 TaxID=3154472 RepID=UPI0033AB4F6C